MFLDSTDPRPVAVVLCGPPGSGKTTFRRAKLPSWGLVSSDNILTDIASSKGLTYSEAYATYISYASSLFLDALAAYALYMRPIILDRTHLTREARASTLTKLNGYRKVAIYFPALTEEELIARVKTRELVNGQGVPDQVIKDMLARYTVPITEEGFDLVIDATTL